MNKDLLASLKALIDRSELIAMKMDLVQKELGNVEKATAVHLHLDGRVYIALPPVGKAELMTLSEIHRGIVDRVIGVITEELTAYGVKLQKEFDGLSIENFEPSAQIGANP